MAKQTLAKLEAWLSYYDDLGLGAFYARRPVMAPGPGERAAEGPRHSPPEVSRLSAAPARPAAEPARAPADETAPVSVANAHSLFEAAERIKGDTLDRIRDDIGECTRCKLHKSRHRIVFGDGNVRAKLVFVGEGPGEEEDKQGLPFVGRAGKLLTQMIEAMGLNRQDVFICNVVKCRPPSNRTPEKDEIATCLPFLERQLAVIGPKVIVCLGSVATQSLLKTGEAMSRLRGKWFEWHGMKLLPTYHPAYLLRNPSAKAIVWEDLQVVMAELGLKPPKKTKPRARA
ncbi:MAG TPA: uracil-DNA glycosylase [Candidatus Dormibacteraeota bacterium]|nr:uracil-DNA glycosylase [Candidatus Dormibacteraeota bacterium]